MKKSMKAALLSGLVFPGAGHFFLKRHALGWLLLGTTMFALIFVVINIVQKAWTIAERIVAAGITPDVTTITAMVLADSSGSESLLTLASWLIAICWVAGIVDSYRIGGAEDSAGEAGT
jgi:hypothetical protein